jgi:HD domain
MSQRYVDGVTDTVTHNLASSLTGAQITPGQDTLTISVVCSDRWLVGDFAVLTRRDGCAFAGQIEAMDVCTGEITIRAGGQLSARTTPLRGLRRPGPPRGALTQPHRSPAHLAVPGAGSPRLHQPSSPVTGRWPGALVLPEPAAGMNALASWAEDLAQALLQEPLPRRWAHVWGVAARARSLAPVLGADADLLQAAAWLHDIGYAPALSLTGLHALDGARHLRDAQHADAMLCRLVAHHSYAVIELEERGIADILVPEFEPAPYLLSSVLTCCDMTTSPDGELLPAEQRLAEIHHHYGPGRATPMILRAVEQIHGRTARTTELRGPEAAKYSHDLKFDLKLTWPRNDPQGQLTRSN